MAGLVPAIHALQFGPWALLLREIMTKPQATRLVVCISNEGYLASLEKRKIYLSLSDADAEKHGLFRVVDESGEDYLYPKAFVREIALRHSRRMEWTVD